jgi:hypothetical protein
MIDKGTINAIVDGERVLQVTSQMVDRSNSEPIIEVYEVAYLNDDNSTAFAFGLIPVNVKSKLVVDNISSYENYNQADNKGLKIVKTYWRIAASYQNDKTLLTD